MSWQTQIWPQKPTVLIGMLHVPALPGSPSSEKSLSEIEDWVLRDATTLAEAGFDALMLENFGDAPFFPGRVPHETVAFMTRLASLVRSKHNLPLGINVLRNDGQSALAVATAADCSFIRVNVLTGARLSDQGIIHGIAHELLRMRRNLGSSGIGIVADVDVKHSAPLAQIPLEDEIHDTCLRGGADAVVISGSTTGKSVDFNQLRASRTILDSLHGDKAKFPLWVGSGVNAASIGELTKHATGLIVGTGVKERGEVSRPVCPQRSLAVVTALNNRCF